MGLTLEQMAVPHFQVVCTTRNANGTFYLTDRGSWTHQDSHVGPAIFTSRAAARKALRRAYKHRDDEHEIKQISGFRPPRR